MTEKEYLKLLGERITEKREEIGFSRDVLAEKVKLTRMHIYRIEKGANPTNIITLRRIAKILGVELSALVDV